MALKHALTNIDVDEWTADCSVCGPSVRIRKSQYDHKAQRQYYRCYRKYIITKTHIERPWVAHKKDHCERCGFLPEDDCQMTVDHIDGNRYNNEMSNWQTLCHNCHILKTIKNKDNTNRY